MPPAGVPIWQPLQGRAAGLRLYRVPSSRQSPRKVETNPWPSPLRPCTCPPAQEQRVTGTGASPGRSSGSEVRRKPAAHLQAGSHDIERVGGDGSDHARTCPGQCLVQDGLCALCYHAVPGLPAPRNPIGGPPIARPPQKLCTWPAWRNPSSFLVPLRPRLNRTKWRRKAQTRPQMPNSPCKSREGPTPPRPPPNRPARLPDHRYRCCTLWGMEWGGG